jgi:hypothetical protein
MKTTRNRLFYIVLGFTLGQLLIGATPVAAQGDCGQLVLAAATKVFDTPTHIYITTTMGGKAQTVEEIYAAGAIYVNVDGKWSRSPITMQAMKETGQKNIQTTKSTCRYLRDEPASGEVASVYSAHGVSPKATVDSQIWISKAKGLPLRSETDLGDKNHVSMRYEYGNVKPPM